MTDGEDKECGKYKERRGHEKIGLHSEGRKR